jgi:hypothetical protein
MAASTLGLRVATLAVVVAFSSSIAVAQLAPSLSPSLAPSPGLNVPSAPLPRIPDAAPAQPAAAAPSGVHRNADGSWTPDPGCHWVNPNDASDLHAACG